MEVLPPICYKEWETVDFETELSLNDDLDPLAQNWTEAFNAFKMLAQTLIFATVSYEARR